MCQQQRIARTTGVEAGINVKKAISLSMRQVSNSLHPQKDTQGEITLFACPVALSGSIIDPSIATLLTSKSSW